MEHLVVELQRGALIIGFDQHVAQFLANQQHHHAIDTARVQDTHIGNRITKLPLFWVDGNDDMGIRFLVAFARLMQEDKVMLCRRITVSRWEYWHHFDRGTFDRRSGGIFYDYTLEVIDTDALLYVVLNRITV